MIPTNSRASSLQEDWTRTSAAHGRALAEARRIASQTSARPCASSRRGRCREAARARGCTFAVSRTEEIVKHPGLPVSWARQESFLEVLDMHEALERKAAERAAVLRLGRGPGSRKGGPHSDVREHFSRFPAPPGVPTQPSPRALGARLSEQGLDQTLDTVLGLIAQRRAGDAGTASTGASLCYEGT